MIDPFIRNLCLDALLPASANSHQAQHERRIALDRIVDILLQDEPHKARLHRRAGSDFNQSSRDLQAQALSRYLASIFKINISPSESQTDIPKLNDEVTNYLDDLMRIELAHALYGNCSEAMRDYIRVKVSAPVLSMTKSISDDEIKAKLLKIDIPGQIKSLLDIDERNLASLRMNLAPYSRTELVNLFKKDFDDQINLEHLSGLALPVLSSIDEIYNKFKQEKIDSRLIAKLRKAVLSLKLDRNGIIDQAAIVYYLAREAQTKIESNTKLTPIMKDLLSRLCDELIFKLIRLIKNSQNLANGQEAFKLLQTKVSKLTGPKEKIFQAMKYRKFAESVHGNDIAQPMFGGHPTLFKLQSMQMRKIEKAVNEQLSGQDKFTTQAEQTLAEYLSASNVIAVPFDPNDQMRLRSLEKLINLLSVNSFSNLLIDAELANEIFRGLDDYGRRLAQGKHNMAVVLQDFLKDSSTNDLQDFLLVDAPRVEEDPYFQAMRSLANRLKDSQTTINIEIKANSENRVALEKANPKKLAYFSSQANLDKLQVPILAVKYIDREDTLADILDHYGAATLDLETAIAFAATQVAKQSKSNKLTMIVNDLADKELLSALEGNKLIRPFSKNYDQKLLITCCDSDDDSEVGDSNLPSDTQAPRDSGPIIMPSTDQNLRRKNIKDFSIVS